MNRERLKANSLILLTVFFWGISATSTKIVLQEVPPATLAFIRFSLAAGLLWVINHMVHPKVVLKREDRKRMLFCGAIGITAYFIFETYGISLISASNATILLASIPIFTLFGEHIALRRKIKPVESIGAFITLLGVGLVIGKTISLQGAFEEVIGSMLLIGAAVSWVIYSIANKELDKKYSTLFNSTYQSIFGSMLLFPFALSEYSEWGAISLLSWGNILYLTIFCSALCTFMYLTALKSLGPTVTNVYINLMPFVGVMTAYIVLKEQLYPLQIAGGLIIILGIFITGFKGRKVFGEGEKNLLTQKS